MRGIRGTAPGQGMLPIRKGGVTLTPAQAAREVYANTGAEQESLRQGRCPRCRSRGLIYRNRDGDACCSCCGNVCYHSTEGGT